MPERFGLGESEMRKQHQEGLQQAKSIATHDRRREERVDMELLIEVCGFDSFLRFFTERTETRNVSGWGCQFPLHIEVSEEAVLAIRVIRQHGEGELASKSALFRVVRVSRGAKGILVHAQKMQPYKIWNAEIPMLN
jgi:RNA:NAD 2'-phosphotransferase (TPT1/KptA family)